MMKRLVFYLLLPLLWAWAGGLHAKSFFGDPPDAHHPWAVHDANRPQPPTVVPGERPGDPPSDAVVLFDRTAGPSWTNGCTRSQLT